METALLQHGLPGIVILALFSVVVVLHRQNQALHKEKNDDAKAHTEQMLTLNDRMHKTVDLMEALYEQTIGRRTPTRSTHDAS